MTDHPITPPIELLKYWENQHFDYGQNVDVLLIHAYQAGADQELEACCKIALTDPCCGTEFQRSNLVAHIKEQRRPKPPGLKKQALSALYAITTSADDAREFYQDIETIKTALEALPND